MNQNGLHAQEIKVIIGLGNPGPRFYFTPHNIGFLTVDQLCEQYHGVWKEKKDVHSAMIMINDRNILLIKPQTFMNSSGQILGQFHKQGIKQENILVVHDEIDYVFGKIGFKQGGSARGHNGLRSLIAHGGDTFLRLRIGVGRPEDASDVGDFVTAPFQESKDDVQHLIETSINMIKNLFL